MGRYGVYGSFVDSDDYESEDDTESCSSSDEYSNPDPNSEDDNESSSASSPEPKPKPKPKVAPKPTVTQSEKVARKARARLNLVRITSKKIRLGLNRNLGLRLNHHRNDPRVMPANPDPAERMLNRAPRFFIYADDDLPDENGNRRGSRWLRSQRKIKRKHIKERSISRKEIKLYPLEELRDLYRLRLRSYEMDRKKREELRRYQLDDGDGETEEEKRNKLTGRCKKIKFANGRFGFFDNTKRINPTPSPTPTSTWKKPNKGAAEASSSTSASASGSGSESASGSGSGSASGPNNPTTSNPQTTRTNKRRPRFSLYCPLFKFLSDCLSTVQEFRSASAGNASTTISIPGSYPGASIV